MEEELFQDELATEGRVTGCGGYGTLFPFVFMALIGGVMRFLLDIEAGEIVIEAGGAWILAGQINLYRRINELFVKQGKEAPLHAWWAVSCHWVSCPLCSELLSCRFDLMFAVSCCLLVKPFFMM